MTILQFCNSLGGENPFTLLIKCGGNMVKFGATGDQGESNLKATWELY